ncbi:hypothetical protein F5B22DRAFT_642653 [Xylaria bambusicola]|uniref:uncharacterized protein n=1 Tax=Xylaria bambusicola TaxID=326684 RepID=UPI00200778FF|nr:uncharacterized protein F5B22DRAFT_642653 [Xylaria bambusicola]KAI0525646.1 hypothetical protein F5B22DRAFT_642653 [Xylaria bambusicola]
MTDQVSGSSLPQTRDLGRQHQEYPLEQPARRHSHLHHYRNVHSSRQHNHQHLHHIRSQKNRRVGGRDTSDDDLQENSDVVVIVETISVLQVTDLTGATIIRTLPHDYPTAPVLTTSSTEPTVAGTTNQPSLTDFFDTTPTNSASDDGNGAADPSSSFSSSVVEEPTVTSSDSSMPISFPTLSYAPITSTPLSAAPVFPSLSGLSNFTLSSSSLSNSTASFQSFTVESVSTESGGSFTVSGSSSSIRSETSHSSLSLSTKSIPGTSTTTSKSSSSVTSSTISVKPDFTPLNGSGGIDSPTVTANGGDSTVIPPATDVSSESDNVSAATIAGSVVGAISGLAIILLLAAAVLRWKKRQSSMNLIQASGNDRGYGATMTGSGGSTGGGGMSQRLSIPFAIPAALAKLSGQSRFSRSTVSSDGGEKGFAKISGRKLPPVLQFGGDGYTDPRATMMSDQSIDYRASQNFFGEAPLSRLAVGAPMLHETSIPVFHASPARTAVETPGSFSDPFSDDNIIESPTLPPDPLGRSQPSHDRSTRSHGSFSRFTEDI